MRQEHHRAPVFSPAPIVSAYERKLEGLSPIDFAAELDDVVACLTPGSDCYAASVVRYGIYRRVMTRRIFRAASS